MFSTRLILFQGSIDPPGLGFKLSTNLDRDRCGLVDLELDKVILIAWLMLALIARDSSVIILDWMLSHCRIVSHCRVEVLAS